MLVRFDVICPPTATDARSLAAGALVRGARNLRKWSLAGEMRSLRALSL